MFLSYYQPLTINLHQSSFFLHLPERISEKAPRDFRKSSERFSEKYGIIYWVLLFRSFVLLRLLQKSTVSQSCEQDCLDFAERMKRKALRVRSEGSIPPY
ncbi:hypothetical protein HMPREF1869_00601 [Bacteroidales bacterium KA00251]|nr:hypothetical protein HMPREF1869_00601 [Bacteroidales bacterium KA00251]